MKEAQHEEIKGLIAPYVLGAVSPDEEARVEAHLRTCDVCRTEAESFDPVKASLASAVDPVEPPDGFVERTMERVAQERAESAPTPLPRRRSRLAWVLSAAALVVVVLVVSFVALGGGGGPDPDEVAALLDEPGLELGGDGVEAKIVETDDGTIFVARGLDPAPEGKVYELWKMTESCAPNRHGPCTVRPAGTFDVEDGLVVTEVEGEFPGRYDHVAVTIEEEEVDQPTSQPILASF